MRTFIFLTFVVIGIHPAFSQSRVSDIYLVRHARVDMKRPAFIGAGKACELLQVYNTTPILDFDPAEVRAHIEVEHPTIITSALLRTLETAKRLFPEDSIVGYAVFNEYQMGIIRIPIIHIPYAAWTGFSRFMWQLGLNKEGENCYESKQHLRAAIALLDTMVRQYSAVVLVAHGYLISKLRKKLQKRGWTLVRNGGNKNLAVSHLTRTE